MAGLSEPRQGSDNSTEVAAKEARLEKFIAKFCGYQTVEPPGALDYLRADGSLQRILSPAALPPKPAGSARLVVISDTHERHQLITLPPASSGCDILVHCGDVLMVNSGFSLETSLRKLADFNHWLATLTQFQAKVVVAGNHDHTLEHLGADRIRGVLSNCTYLQDEHVVIDLKCGGRLEFFGTPASVSNSPQSPNVAFQYPSERVQHIFEKVVQPHVDVLITHGPVDTLDGSVERFLAQHHIPIVLSGHIHELHGARLLHHGKDERAAGLGTRVVNAVTMGPRFSPTNAPIVLDIAFRQWRSPL